MTLGDLVERYLPGDTSPMPPEGWPAVVEGCCEDCSRTARIERELRAWYGTLFAVESDQ